MEIQPGTPIQWESQSGGYYKQKKGIVIAFIPPGENAEKYLETFYAPRAAMVEVIQISWNFPVQNFPRIWEGNHFHELRN